MGMLHRSTDFEKLRKDCDRRGFSRLNEAINIYNNLNLLRLSINKLRNIQKSINTKEVDSLREEALSIKKQIAEKGVELTQLQSKVDYFNRIIPNYLDEEVPSGKSETDNVVTKTWGETKKWSGVHHYNLPDYHHSLTAGSRFSRLSGKTALLARKLVDFAMDAITKNGFEEHWSPEIFPSKHFINTGHFSNPQSSLFPVGDDSWLIPTGEVSLLSVVAEMRSDLAKESRVELKLCTYSSCFRKEAGSAGKDWKGLIRNHQFQKVEMVVVANRELEQNIFNEILDNSCKILEKLLIPYRVILLCAGDTGINGTMTKDIEVMIGGKWREVASISKCGIRQSIGLKLKNKDKEFLVTLNGTGLAVGRIVAAIMEMNRVEEVLNIINRDTLNR